MAIDQPHRAAPHDRGRRSPITPPDSSSSGAGETPEPAPDSSPPTGASVVGFLETASVRGAAGFLDVIPASPTSAGAPSTSTSSGARAFLTAALTSSTSPSADEPSRFLRATPQQLGSSAAGVLDDATASSVAFLRATPQQLGSSAAGVFGDATASSTSSSTFLSGTLQPLGHDAHQASWWPGMLVIVGDADARHAFWWSARHARDALLPGTSRPDTGPAGHRHRALLPGSSSETVPDAGADHRSAPLVFPGDALQAYWWPAPIVVPGDPRRQAYWWTPPLTVPVPGSARQDSLWPALTGVPGDQRQESMWVALLVGFGLTDPTATATTHRGYVHIGTSTSDAHPDALTRMIAAQRQRQGVAAVIGEGSGSGVTTTRRWDDDRGCGGGRVAWFLPCCLQLVCARCVETARCSCLRMISPVPWQAQYQVNGVSLPPTLVRLPHPVWQIFGAATTSDRVFVVYYHAEDAYTNGDDAYYAQTSGVRFQLHAFDILGARWRTRVAQFTFALPSPHPGGRGWLSVVVVDAPPDPADDAQAQH